MKVEFQLYGGGIFMNTKTIVLVSVLIIMLMTSAAFAGSIYTTNEMDKKEIQDITNSFFLEKEEAFLSDNNFDITKFYGTAEAKSAKSDSSLKLFEFEKKIRNDNYSDISNEKFEYYIDSITISDDKAIAKCYEYYEYTYKNDPIRSSRGIEYQLTFGENDGKWELIDVITNNELENLVEETDNISSKYVFDFDIVEKVGEDDSKYSKGINATSAVTHEYNRSAAAEYALEYSDSTHTTSATSAYNSKFPEFAPNDCQNFVSQCVWAGLGGSDTTTAINNRNKPMITSGDRAWYCNKSGHSATWSMVGDFRNYIVKEDEEKEGIYGVRYAKGSIAKAQKGDVVQICDSSGSWYHSYIISSVTGTYGSRTLSNINICAHTSNRRNENLANVIGADSTNFRLLRINGTRY